MDQTRIDNLKRLKQIIDSNINNYQDTTVLMNLNNYFMPQSRETCGCKKMRIIAKLESFWLNTGRQEYDNISQI